MPRRIAFVGLGLIGGSLARTLRARAPEVALSGWSPDGRGPAAAVTAGVIERAARTLGAAVSDADLVVLAGPPDAIVALLETEVETLGAVAARGATLTDVASTKAMILAAADRAGLPFVGGHPMAGREATGFEASDAGLFDGRPWVVVGGTLARDRDLVRVRWLVETVGARAVTMAAAEHDATVAAISHLPLVASAALVEAVAGSTGWAAARDLAATGWTGMTRLARGDATMGAGILATNREPIATWLRAYRAAIDEWLAALEGEGGRGDVGVLRRRLAAARARLDALPDG